MTLFALVLVLTAAVFHATWKLLAKRGGDGGAAIVLFGERPSPLVFLGIGLITAGVFVLTSESGSLGTGLGAGVVYGLLTGVFIAAYTIWDKQAVSALLIPPLLQSWATAIVTTLLLTPLAMGNRKKIKVLWRENKPEIFGVAILSPLSYILVLTALVFTPVSYVAPAREISILIGAAMGSRLFSEGDSTRRLIAAGAMVIGIIALALG